MTFDISQIANEKKVASFSSKVKKSRGLSTITDYKYIYEDQIVISFIGDFNQFATFLNALERHRPVIFVDKFSLTRSGQEDSVYKVSLNVAALVKKQQDGRSQKSEVRSQKTEVRSQTTEVRSQNLSSVLCSLSSVL